MSIIKTNLKVLKIENICLWVEVKVFLTIVELLQLSERVKELLVPYSRLWILRLQRLKQN